MQSMLKEVDPYQRKYQQLLGVNTKISTVLGTINAEMVVESTDDFYDYAFYRFTLKHNGNTYILDSSKDLSEIDATLGALAYELVLTNFQQNLHREENTNYTKIDDDALETVKQIKDYFMQKVAMLLVSKNYFEQGLNAVPVQGKAPLVKWTQWQTDRQTEEDFKSLPWKDADGFAIICGLKTAGLYIAVVDFDVKNVTEEAREKGSKILDFLPRTQVEVTPSGGLHYIYLCKEKPKNIIAFHDVCALEVIGENKLCVMAPSKGYRRLTKDVPKIIDNIETLFYEVLKKAGVPIEEQKQEGIEFQLPELQTWFNTGLAEPYKGKDPPCITSILQGVNAGERNESTIRLASYLLNFKQLKKATVREQLLQWNKLNKPCLEEKELRTIIESTEKNGYVFGCNDGLLRKHCSGKTKCELGKYNMTVEELIEEEIQKQAEIQLHPLIDYHPKIGLTYGFISGDHSQILYFCRGSLNTFKFNAIQNGAKESNCISFKDLQWTRLSPIHRSNFLLLARDYCKTGEIKNAIKNKVFENSLRKIKSYWWHSDSRWHIAVTCWVLGTYFHPIFAFYPILAIQGIRGSGKTTLLDVFQQICWNATGKNVSVREAALFRTVQGTRGTYINDITKMAFDNDTKDVIDVLESGTEKGGVVRRVNIETNEPIEYETYGPKAIAVRYTLPFAEKCILIISAFTAEKEYAKLRAKIHADEDWFSIVGDFMASAIRYWPEVVEAYDNIEQTDRLVGRPFNYWSPLLAICKVFAPEHYQELLSLAEEEAEKAERGDRLSEVEETILIIAIQEEGQTENYLLKDLTKKVQEMLPWVESWQIVKSALQNLGIVNKIYDSKQGKKYLIDLNKAREKAKARNIKISEIEQDAKDFCLQLPDFLKEVASAAQHHKTLAEIRNQDLTEIPLESLGEEYYCMHYKNFADVVKLVEEMRGMVYKYNEGFKQHLGFEFVEKDNGKIYVRFK